jgi:hypothetical protein
MLDVTSGRVGVAETTAWYRCDQPTTPKAKTSAGKSNSPPILVYGIYGDEAGFAELMPQQEEWMKPLWTFVEAVVARTTSTILGADALWSTATATSVPTTPQASRRPLVDRS